MMSLPRIEIFEGMDAYNFHDLVETIMPRPGYVSYAKNLHASNVESFYMGKPNPQYEVPEAVYGDKVSTVASRNAARARARPAAAAAVVAAAAAATAATAVSRTEKELKENETTLQQNGFNLSCQKHSLNWGPVLDRVQAEGAEVWHPAFLQNEQSCMGFNWIDAEADEPSLNLPTYSMVIARHTDKALPVLTASPASPVVLDEEEGQAFEAELRGYGALWGSASDPERMKHRCTVGELLHFVTVHNPCLVDLTVDPGSGFEFNADALVVNSWMMNWTAKVCLARARARARVGFIKF